MYFVLEVPESNQVGALAQEAALVDPVLDELELQLADRTIPVDARLALAFQLGRAGRRSSGKALAALRAELVESDHPTAAQLLLVTMDLLPIRPVSRLERADGGYRWTSGSTQIFVEDAIAAQWHAIGRWGPPIRPDLDRAPRFFGSVARASEMKAHAVDGGILVVTFRSLGAMSRREPALRI
ncbi:MAG: hypothetical protein HC923_13540, partial [Myxococcales bacterium]|nr:hypothetical protein [Myxococcales bacterium]